MKSLKEQINYKWIMQILFLAALVLVPNMSVHAESQAEALVRIAKSEVGQTERSKGSDDIKYNDWYYGKRVNNYNIKGYVYGKSDPIYPWCAVFVSWCADQAGILDTVIPKTAAAKVMLTGTEGAEKLGGVRHKRGDGYKPQKGDIILFNWKKDGSVGNIHHVGIVDYSTDEIVYYIDGNCTDTDPHSVHSSKRSLNDTNIWGYCHPNYKGAPQKSYVDLGSDFYAYIINTASWKHATNDSNGNVCVRTETGDANQIWHFERQSDGSYKISSLKDGKVMEVHNFESANGTNVEMNSWSGNSAQRWFIYGSSSNYVLKAACGTNVLDMKGGGTYPDEGTNLQMWKESNTSSQYFQIWSGINTDVSETPNVSASQYYYLTGDNAVIRWTKATKALSYHLTVLYRTEDATNATTIVDKDVDANGTYTFTEMRAGKYHVYLYANGSNNNTCGETVFYVRGELADLGDIFSARIMHLESGRLVTFNNLGKFNAVIGTSMNEKIARQIWNFTRNSDGSYKIQVCVNDSYLRVEDNEDKNNQNVETGMESQNWFIYKNPDDTYFFRPACSKSKVLYLLNNDAYDGNNMQIYSYHGGYSQKFMIYSCGQVLNMGNEFDGFIMNSGYWKPIIQTDDNNAVLGSETTDNMDRSLWHFTRNESDGTYSIRSYLNDNYLTVENDEDEAGANIICAPANHKPGQAWYFIKRDDGTTYIKSACSNRNLDLKDNESSDGSNIELNDLENTNRQKFSIYPLDVDRDALSSYRIVADKNEITYGESTEIRIGNVNYVTQYTFVVVSPDNTVTMVDNGGSRKYKFTGTQEGTYTIYAKVHSPVSEYSGSQQNEMDCVKVTVVKKEQALHVSLPQSTIAEGEKTSILADGKGMISYSSNNEKIAQVNSDGIITGIGAGNAIITILAKGNEEYNSTGETINITVTHNYTAEITSKATCTEDGVRTYACSGCGATYSETIPAIGHKWLDWVVVKDATEIEAGLETRTCENDPSHIETKAIDKLEKQNTEENSDAQSELNTETRASTVTDTSAETWTSTEAHTTAETKGSKIKNQAKVKVAELKVTGISGKIAADKKIKLSPIVLPENASNKTLKWTTSNNKIATVSKKGVVTIKKKTGGKSVKITASATDGSGKKAVWNIKVMKGTVTKITVKGAKATLKPGKTMKLKATVKATKGANKKLKWISSNTKYATVSAKGVVKALKAGKGKTVKITVMATDGSNKKKVLKVKIK